MDEEFNRIADEEHNKQIKAEADPQGEREIIERRLHELGQTVEFSDTDRKFMATLSPKDQQIFEQLQMKSQSGMAVSFSNDEKRILNERIGFSDESSK